jgi:putative addiction module killer protein
MFEIQPYTTRDRRNVIREWLEGIKDKAAKVAIERRFYRVQLGNLGDHKSCRGGVWELRIDIGPGYRVYYAQDGKTIILLLCGGVKRTQDADIDQALEYWKDWQHRAAV